MTTKKVLVYGGTHGNEWTGILVVKEFADRLKQKFPDLDIQFILSNPEAYKISRRFKDEDLNRAFKFLNENRPHSFEHKRAKEIKAQIDESPCFVIDLHTTTSHMGRTVILCSYDSLNITVADALAKKAPDCKIIGSPDPHKKYLVSQSQMGMMVEVGPVANGLIEPKALEGTLGLLEIIFQALTQNLPPQGDFEIYEEIQDIPYPLNEKSELKGYIHSEFQGKDFVPVKGKYSVFQTFSGETIQFETDEVLYPIFINEAAYYPQQLAFTLCRKKPFPK